MLILNSLYDMHLHRIMIVLFIIFYCTFVLMNTTVTTIIPCVCVSHVELTDYNTSGSNTMLN